MKYNKMSMSDWDIHYNALVEYIAINDRLPPYKHTFMELKLGRWCASMRKAYSNLELQQNYINKLEQLNYWIWPKYGIKWIKYYNLMLEYASIHKCMPLLYTKFNNKKLGVWYYAQKDLVKKEMLSDSKIQLLSNIPYWSWDNKTLIRWSRRYHLFKIYIQKYGILPVKREISNMLKINVANSSDFNGLWEWYQSQLLQYNKKTIKRTFIHKLEQIDMHQWYPDYEKWYIMYHNILNNIISTDDPTYIKWHDEQLIRYEFKINNINNNVYSWITDHLINKLEKINGWDWTNFIISNESDLNMLKLKIFSKAIKNYPTDENCNDLKFIKWCNSIYIKYISNKLSKNEIEMFTKSIGWINYTNEKRWNFLYNELVKYVSINDKMPSIHNSITVYPPVGKSINLGKWCSRQRTKYNTNRSNFDEHKIILLEQIDTWTWNVSENTWEITYNKLLKYINKYKSLPSPKTNNKLYKWIKIQHISYDRKNIAYNIQEKLTNTPYWEWPNERSNKLSYWKNRYSILMHYIVTNNMIPNVFTVYNDFKLGIWCNNQKCIKNNLEHTNPNNYKLLDSINGWNWNYILPSWIKNCTYVIKFIKKFNKLPHNTYKINGELNIGKWFWKQVTILHQLSDNKLNKEQLFIIKNMLNFEIDFENMGIQMNDEEITFNVNRIRSMPPPPIRLNKIRECNTYEINIIRYLESRGINVEKINHDRGHMKFINTLGDTIYIRISNECNDLYIPNIITIMPADCRNTSKLYNIFKPYDIN